MAEAEPMSSGSLGGDGVVNAHFSVNQAVLRSLVEPMVLEMFRDTKHEARLGDLEAALDTVQFSIQQKADAKALRDVVNVAQEQKQQLPYKADKCAVAEVRAMIVRLEETMAYKAHQTSIDELTAGLQRVADIANQKAELNYLNRTNDRLNKLAQGASQHEKQLAELIARHETMEAWKLPQTLQRTREMLLQTNGRMKTLQDSVALKADQQLVDELILGYKEVECNVNCKASQQSVIELHASVNDFQRQLETKAGHLAIEEPLLELDRIKDMLPSKAEKQEILELAAKFPAIERALSQKADFETLNNTRARFNSIEVNVQQKADRIDFQEVTASLSETREWMAHKIEQIVEDFSKRPEAEALVNAEAALERLLIVCEQKVDVQTVSEVEQKIADMHSDVIRQLGQKVEQTSFEETVESLALRMGMAESPGSNRSGYPPSCTSLSTTDSYPTARRGGKLSNARSTGVRGVGSPAARGVSPATRVGRPPLKESKSM